MKFFHINLLMICVCFSLFTAKMIEAEEGIINLPVTVNVPKASGTAIQAFKMNPSVSASSMKMAAGASSSGIEAESENGTPVSNLDFGYLVLLDNIWVPRDSAYFLIKVSPIGGAGSPNVTVTYQEGQKPTGQTKGLGYKGQIAFTKNDAIMSSHPLKLLREVVGGEFISSSELNGATLKIYVGLIGNSADVQPLLNRGGEPFKKDDKAGDYNGILTITSTIE